jgi:hypothetical protein
MQLWLFGFIPSYCNCHALHLLSAEGGGGVKIGEVYVVWCSLMGKGCVVKKKVGGELAKPGFVQFEISEIEYCDVFLYDWQFLLGLHVYQS